MLKQMLCIFIERFFPSVSTIFCIRCLVDFNLRYQMNVSLAFEGTEKVAEEKKAQAAEKEKDTAIAKSQAELHLYN